MIVEDKHMTIAKPIQTRCDRGCQKEFTITKTRKIKVKNGIDMTYFRCPHCKEEYIVSYVGPATAKLQREIRKLQKSLPKLPDDNNEFSNKAYEIALDEHWEEVDELKAKVKQSMDNDRRIAESEGAHIS